MAQDIWVKDLLPGQTMSSEEYEATLVAKDYARQANESLVAAQDIFTRTGEIQITFTQTYEEIVAISDQLTGQLNDVAFAVDIITNGYQTIADNVGLSNAARDAAVSAKNDAQAALLAVQQVDLSAFYTKTQTDNLLATNYYTRSQSNSQYFTKTQINTTFALYYTSAQVDTLIAGYYTKAQVDTADNLRAPKASPALTGSPTLGVFDAGTTTTGTKTLDFANGARQKWTVNGAVTLAVNNLPTDGSGDMEVIIYYQSGSIVWPSWLWSPGDGTKNAAFSSLGITLVAGNYYRLLIQAVGPAVQAVFA